MEKTIDDHAKWMKIGMRLYLFPVYEKFRRKTVELAEIQQDDIVLDFGCGVGLLEKYLLDKLGENGKVFGVDIGQQLIEIAGTSYAGKKNVQFLCVDYSDKLPFSDGTFSLIVTNLVSHLLDRKQRETTYREFYRTLKPDGRILLAEVGKPESLYGYWMKFIHLNHWAKIYPYEKNSCESFEGKISGYIKDAGFKRVEVVSRMRGYIDFIQARK